MLLSDVIEGLTGYKIEAPQSISQVVIDSREAGPGSLFVALPGEQTDGHHYVAHAFQNGASAAITDRPVPAVPPSQTIEAVHFDPTQPLPAGPVCLQVDHSLAGLQALARFWRQKFQPRVIGVTGSVGKSTTKELLWNVLATRFNTLKSEGNYNNEIGLPLTLLKLNETHERVVLEMGMYDLGEIKLLCQLAQPQIGVVTIVGPVHLERLGTIERIAQAKAELVQALPSDGVAILNYDDERVRQMAALTQARVMTYGLSPQADLWGDQVVSAGLEGVRFVFHYGGEEIHAKIPMLGRHSVHTALRAALVGLVEGLAWEDIISGLQSLPRSAQLRLVSVKGPNQSTILDDTYNASPPSTLAALNLLDDLSATKKIAVLGEMMELGSYEEEGHRKVGCRAADVVDQLIVIGPLTRYIVAEAKACGLAEDQILELDSNQAAIAYLRQTLAPGNLVLIKASLSRRMGEIVAALSVQNGETQ
ncbi:MAG TPA: UDP-N-acetylmuramoyl-tripeptide--D-alanyl-D-alanine ligase [Anaerolineae bacterium]|nr:UDP-N-acetylmuramoyl-tripeptide--D-alanyl-D-alanine ligase [Anaerolineae bacterium]HMR65239.1 UDP-N-acetylmuramoyl-tripeptide--D-alanyl-D-alanine ligase [Anaerolineae bacterium]